MTDRLLSSPVESAPAFFTAGPVWIAGVVKKPAKLLWVRDELAKLDVVEEAYVPTITQVRTIFGKPEEIETPVPGWGRYFFVRLLLDAAGDWTAARYQPGVLALLPAHSLRPLRIAQRFVEEVKQQALADQEALLGLVKALRRFFEGEAVDILDPRVLEMHGAASGTVEWQHGRRVRVQLSCQGSAKAVTLPADQLAPSGSSGRRTQPRPCRKRARTRAVYPARDAI